MFRKDVFSYLFASLPIVFYSLVSLVFWNTGLHATSSGGSAKKAGIELHALEIVPVELSASEKAEVDEMVLPLPPSRADDFDGMRNRHLIRILVPYSKTFFFIDRGQQQGVEYEFGKALEVWLNKKHPIKEKRHSWKILFIPVKRDQLLPDLIAGKGDIAAGGLTITPDRLKIVDFAAPYAEGIREALVTGPAAPVVQRLEDLAGREVSVRASSSYFEHLQEINRQFSEKGLKPIKIRVADEWLESEDILEMVNAGILQATFVDRYLAQIWKPLYTDLAIHDIFLNTEGKLGWAIRKNSPQFKSVLDRFMKEHKVGTTFGNILVQRYVKNEKRVINATSAEEMRKFKMLVDFFKKHADQYDFDFLMLVAQGFQESRLDQNARSHKGAVGVMQLLPATAADPAIGITGIDKDAERNIEAGAKYLRLLANKYLDDPGLDPTNKTLMAFAAYNAGPGNLRKFRRLAEKSGRNPNIWFQNVEYGAARIVGQETVNYVSNIYKYYLAYKLALEQVRVRSAPVKQ